MSAGLDEVQCLEKEIARRLSVSRFDSESTLKQCRLSVDTRKVGKGYVPMKIQDLPFDIMAGSLYITSPNSELQPWVERMNSIVESSEVTVQSFPELCCREFVDLQNRKRARELAKFERTNALYNRQELQSPSTPVSKISRVTPSVENSPRSHVTLIASTLPSTSEVPVVEHQELDPMEIAPVTEDDVVREFQEDLEYYHFDEALRKTFNSRRFSSRDAHVTWIVQCELDKIIQEKVLLSQRITVQRNDSRRVTSPDQCLCAWQITMQVRPSSYYSPNQGFKNARNAHQNGIFSSFGSGGFAGRANTVRDLFGGEDAAGPSFLQRSMSSIMPSSGFSNFNQSTEFQLEMEFSNAFPIAPPALYLVGPRVTNLASQITPIGRVLLSDLEHQKWIPVVNLTELLVNVQNLLTNADISPAFADRYSAEHRGLESRSASVSDFLPAATAPETDAEMQARRAELLSVLRGTQTVLPDTFRLESLGEFTTVHDGQAMPWLQASPEEVAAVMKTPPARVRAPVDPRRHHHLRIRTYLGSLHHHEPEPTRPLPVIDWSAVQTKVAARGEDNCAICMCEFDGQEGEKCVLSCTHVFHKQCIDTFETYYQGWRQKMCPCCRAQSYQKLVV